MGRRPDPKKKPGYLNPDNKKKEAEKERREIDARCFNYETARQV